MPTPPTMPETPPAQPPPPPPSQPEVSLTRAVVTVLDSTGRTRRQQELVISATRLGLPDSRFARIGILPDETVRLDLDVSNLGQIGAQAQVRAHLVDSSGAMVARFWTPEGQEAATVSLPPGVVATVSMVSVEPTRNMAALQDVALVITITVGMTTTRYVGTVFVTASYLT